jgi:ribulose 1,5-bisphosphate synthetase/thiazole synthase
MVSGFEAFVGRLLRKLYNFSLPFNSLMFTVIGNRLLNSVTVELLRSVALKVLDPMIILNELVVVSKSFGAPVVSVLFDSILSFLLQDEHPINIERAEKRYISKCAIVADFAVEIMR